MWASFHASGRHPSLKDLLRMSGWCPSGPGEFYCFLFIRNYYIEHRQEGGGKGC